MVGSASTDVNAAIRKYWKDRPCTGSGVSKLDEMVIKETLGAHHEAILAPPTARQATLFPDKGD